MFGISGFEFLIIGVVALLLFGPDKLPQFGRTIGGVIRQFNNAKDEMEKVVRTEMYAGDSSKTSSVLGGPSSPFETPKSEASKAEAPAAPKVAADFDEDEEEEEE